MIRQIMLTGGIPVKIDVTKISIVDENSKRIYIEGKWFEIRDKYEFQDTVALWESMYQD